MDQIILTGPKRKIAMTVIIKCNFQRIMVNIQSSDKNTFAGLVVKILVMSGSLVGLGKTPRLASKMHGVCPMMYLKFRY